jgi:hypothetical protein
VASLPVGTPIGKVGDPRAFAQEATPVFKPGAQVDGPVCNSTMVMFCLDTTEYESTSFTAFANCSDPSDITT